MHRTKRRLGLVAGAILLLVLSGCGTAATGHAGTRRHGTTAAKDRCQDPGRRA